MTSRAAYLHYSENPFADTVQAHAATEPGPDSFTYQLLKNGPDVNPQEVELPHVDAIEVTLCWGSNVLATKHLTPPRAFYVGEATGKAEVDFFLPAEKLGTIKMPLLLCDQRGTSVVIPAAATGSVEVNGQILDLDEARAQSVACSELSGAHSWPLPPKGQATLELNGFSFFIRAVNAGKPVPAGLGDLDWNTASYFGASFLGVGSLLLAMAFFMPPLGLTDGELSIQDQLILLQQYESALAEKEKEPEENPDAKDSSLSEGGQGEQAQDAEGAMGKKDSPQKNKMYAVEGPRDNPDPHLSRHQALREAAEFGIIGFLSGDPDAPTAPWGRDTALGVHDTSAMGAMWGDELGESGGLGGLGLSGLGEGGGGRGIGIGLDSVGTIGRGRGGGDDMGFGRDGGRGLTGAHATTVPKMGIGKTVVSGRLPPQVIQRIVRQNFGRFRLCYEKGLTQNPNLEGRVSVRFVIDRNGAVTSASNGGSSLPDANVVNCVVRSYYGLSFPKPEGGIVTVSYPITFSPG